MTAPPRGLGQFAIGIRNPGVGAHQGYATAFFGRRRGRLGLYTAFHNLTKNQAEAKPFIPANNRSRLVQAIEVYLDRDPAAVRVLRLIPAEDSEGLLTATRVATCWAPLPQHIWDVARLSSSVVDELFDATGGRVAAVNLDEVGEPVPRSPVRAVGYPPVTPVLDLEGWAYSPATSYEGAFIRTVEHHLQVGLRPDAGLSGGPVFTEDDALVGMLVGKDVAMDLASQYPHMLARIVPASAFADL